MCVGYVVCGCVVCGVCGVWGVWCVGCVVCGLCGVWGMWCVGCVVCGVCGVWDMWCVGYVVTQLPVSDSKWTSARVSNNLASCCVNLRSYDPAQDGGLCSTMLMLTNHTHLNLGSSLRVWTVVAPPNE